jgi:hypothetical protein
MNVNIDFEDVYPFEIMDPDCSKFSFICPVVDVVFLSHSLNCAFPKFHFPIPHELNTFAR